MNSRQRRKRALRLQQQRAFTRADHHFITPLTESGVGILSKANAKGEKRYVKHCRENERWQPGFKGDVPTTGKEMLGYVPTIRVKDGTRRISAKAWLRK